MNRLLKIVGLLGLAGAVYAGPSAPPAGNYIVNSSTLVSKPATNVSSITVRDNLGLGYGTQGNLLYLSTAGVVTTTTTIPTGGDVFKASTQTFTGFNTFNSSTTLKRQVKIQTTGAGQGTGVGGSILVWATDETGMPIQVYSSSANQAGFFGMVNLINSNTNYANAYLYVSGASSATNKADIYLTNPQPNIQFVETGVVSPAGQYEFAVISDTFQLRSMNSGGSAYKSRIGMTHPGALAFYETSDNGHFVALKASATITADVTWIMPTADGTSGQLLTTDGSGNLTWSGGGAGTDIQNTSTLQSGATFYVSSGTIQGPLSVGDNSLANPLTIKIPSTVTDASILFSGTSKNANVDYYSDPSTLFSRLNITNTNLNSGVTEKRYRAGWNFEDANTKVLAYISKTTGGLLVLNSTGAVTMYDGPTNNFVTMKASDTISTSHIMKLPEAPATSTGSWVTVKAISGVTEDLQFTQTVTSGTITSLNTATFKDTGLTAGQMCYADTGGLLQSDASILRSSTTPAFTNLPASSVTQYILNGSNYMGGIDYVTTPAVIINPETYIGRAIIVDDSAGGGAATGDVVRSLYLSAAGGDTTNAALWVQQGDVNLQALTASRMLRLDASKNIISSATLTTTELAGKLQAAQFPALTGDVTTVAGALATTLASVVTANQYGSATVVPVITFDAKGRLTAVSSATISASGGGGYALQPATVTVQLNFGVTATTVTVSSNTILAGATFYAGGTNIQLGTSTFNGNLSFAAGNGIVGTTTNDNAVAGNYGETSSTIAVTTNFGASGVWSDLVSTQVANGDYLFSFIATADPGSIGTFVDWEIGISVTSGNSTTGLTQGSNRAIILGTTADDVSGAIPMYRLSFNTPTTVYAKIKASYSGGTGAPRIVGGRLTWLRIR